MRELKKDKYRIKYSVKVASGAFINAEHSAT